eukprot:3770297-Amphidinium_carterae.3
MPRAEGGWQRCCLRGESCLRLATQRQHRSNKEGSQGADSRAQRCFGCQVRVHSKQLPCNGVARSVFWVDTLLSLQFSQRTRWQERQLAAVHFKPHKTGKLTKFIVGWRDSLFLGVSGGSGTLCWTKKDRCASVVMSSGNQKGIRSLDRRMRLLCQTE